MKANLFLIVIIVLTWALTGCASMGVIMKSMGDSMRNSNTQQNAGYTSPTTCSDTGFNTVNCSGWQNGQYKYQTCTRDMYGTLTCY